MDKRVLDENGFDPIIENNDTYYHYCSMESFYNIIKSGTVWLSDINKMNDPMENYFYKKNLDDYRYIFQRKVAEKFFDRFNQCSNYKYLTTEKNSLKEYIEELEQIKNTIDRLRNVAGYYIFCLTKNSNDLSQWRMYANEAKGICMGFNSKIFKKYISDTTNYLDFTKIDYSLFNAKCECDILIKQMEKSLLEEQEINAEYYENMNCKFIELSEKSHLFKDSCYSYENEYRITAMFDNKYDINKIKTRLQNNEIVKYVELPLNEMGLCSVTLGPLNNNTREDIEFFLKQNNINTEKIKIHKSTLPYRVNK